MERCHHCNRETEMVCAACGKPTCPGCLAQDDVCHNCWACYEDYLDAQADPGDMDGDHESALASAGLGTDEDYGYFGGDEW